MMKAVTAHRPSLPCVILGAILGTTLALFSFGTQAQQAQQRTELDALVRQSAQQFIGAPQHVGLSIGIIDHGVIRTWGFGTTNKVDGHLPDEHTIYEIGSVTKTYTGILLAQAILDGKIQLSDPVQRYLAAPYRNLAFAGRPVRIIDLANHTAGLPKHIRTLKDGLTVAQTLEAYGDYSERQFLQDLKKIRLHERPGSAFHYSNVDTQLVGIILERLYHKPYAELVKQFITGPNGMHDTTLALVPEQQARAAQGYDGGGQAMPGLRFWRHIPAAGSLRSSVQDQLVYLKWNLDAVDPAVALSHRVTFEHTEERGDAIALYWFVNRSPDGTAVIRHTGGSFGSTSYLAFYPERGLGMVLLANDTDASTETALVQMGEAIARRLAPGNP